MPTEQEWRDKYREVLSRLAADEARWSKNQNVLKLLIGRLCLAAQGRDDRLDHELARVAEVARKQIDLDQLDVLIAPLSAAVAALDSAERVAHTSTSTSVQGKNSSAASATHSAAVAQATPASVPHAKVEEASPPTSSAANGANGSAPAIPPARRPRSPHQTMQMASAPLPSSIGSRYCPN